MSDRKGSTAVADRRSSQALEIFERAVKAVGKKDFERALDLLETLIESHPEERDLLERARSYRLVCQRALEKRPAFRPKGFEDLLNYGVFLHNRGEFPEALKYLQQAAEIHPRNEHVMYCLAATSARAGEAAAALKALRTAIAVNPANRAQARSDADFDPIRDDPEFIALLSNPSS
jgi:tetratricopeptide (TPR) repeat protein